MKSRQASSKKSTFNNSFYFILKLREILNSKTPADILFNIMSKLDVQHIMLLWFAANNSRLYWKSNGNIASVLSHSSFWQANAEHHLQAGQLSGEINHRKLMSNRYQASQIIKNNLHDFAYSLLSESTGCYFELGRLSSEELSSFLLKDDAQGLFHKIIGKPELLPLLKNDNYDVKAIQDCMKTQNLEGHHLNFMGLFPSMVKLRAVNCFDLFFRTFIILFSSIAPAENLLQKYYGSLENLEKLILGLGDNYFNAQCISLAIKLAKNKANPAPIVQYAIEAGYYDALRSSLNAISNEQFKEILKNCPNESTLLSSFLYSEPKYKASLNKTITKAISINTHNDHQLEKNINELLILREQMNTHFDQWIQELHHRKPLGEKTQGHEHEQRPGRSGHEEDQGQSQLSLGRRGF
jgi:hypothetical protein